MCAIVAVLTVVSTLQLIFPWLGSGERILRYLVSALTNV
jgi:hypothetical protein